MATLPASRTIDTNGVQVDDRLRTLQGAIVPASRLFHHRLGHRRDQFRQKLNAIKFLNDLANLTHTDLLGVQRQNLVIEPRSQRTYFSTSFAYSNPRVHS
ncbi:MAG: hypothetical protein OXC80_08960, partial [Gammaproteobacteria bacterium]|nr:hypothetical protein [Gammaproteobacteria bacterium]